jgi:hypothetical protein
MLWYFVKQQLFPYRLIMPWFPFGAKEFLTNEIVVQGTV